MAQGAFVVDIGRGQVVRRYVAESVAEIVPLLRRRKGEIEIDYLRMERIESVRSAWPGSTEAASDRVDEGTQSEVDSP